MKNWQRYPALYYGIAMIAGISLTQGIWIPLLFLFLSDRLSRALGFLIITLAAFIHTTFLTNPPIPEHHITGVGYYTFQKVRHTVSMSKHGLNYQGTLNTFIANGVTYKNIPCYITMDEPIKRPKGDRDYIVHGNLSPIGHGLYKMFVDQWTPVPYTYNFAETRFHLKDRIRAHLKKHVYDRRTYAFLASLSTGEIENRMLSIAFSKAGLNHTLAISGFHYTWLVITLGATLRYFFNRRKVAYILLILLSIYFVFIGESASLNRAWLAAVIYLVAYLIKESSSGINSLGVALIVCLTLDPFAMNQVGFQLSYLATFGILALYPTTEKWLGVLLPIRTYFETQSLSTLNQYGYVLASVIRKSVALTFTINALTFPVLLYDFQYFPFASLFFNLFFPFAITITMIALILALCLPFFSPQILSFAEWYSNIWLNMIFHMIHPFRYEIWVLDMSLVAVTISVTALIFLGLYLDEKRYQLTIIRPHI